MICETDYQLPIFAEKSAKDERHVRRAFAQTAHEVRKPLAAKGNVKADAIAGFHEHSLEIPAYAVQHLKLEPFRCYAVIGRPSAREVEHRLVVVAIAG
jgi:hypothetical protein